MKTNARFRLIIFVLILSLILTTGSSEEVRDNIEPRGAIIETAIYDSIVKTITDLKYEEDERIRKEQALLEEKNNDVNKPDTKDSSDSNNLKPIISYTDSEYDLFCRLVMRESGGESYQCQLATATVVVNRVRSASFPDTLEGVIKQSGQFSARTDKRPTESVKKACWAAVCGKGNIPSSVLYFRASKSKKWGSHTFYKRIGGHSFYKQ